jgi:Holliday junction resolvase RusA-like endonuclease
MVLYFTVAGPPVGKGRPRFTVAGGRARAFTPTATARYEALVKAEYLRQVGNLKLADKAPVGVNVEAWFKTPTSAAKARRAAMERGDIRPVSKPDLDNIMKAICDALNGVAYADDSQIVSARIAKRYSSDPRVEVTVYDEEPML